MADQEGTNGSGKNPQPTTPSTAAPNVDWDHSQMRNTYANVVNVSSTREEVSIFFGTNQTWQAAGSPEFKVQLSDRVILNPFAAKRLFLLMGNLLEQYEKRFGKLDVTAQQRPEQV